MVVYVVYLILFMGFVQRIILVPLAWAFPVLTLRLLGPWSRMQARVPLVLMRVIAGVRVTVDGRIGPENRVVIMNHQSLFDVCIGITENPGKLLLIPTRKRYARGIPGISVFIRLCGFPLITQTRKSIRADLAAIADAAERCRRGEASFFVFAEGHRSKDGSILPFMTRGLRIVLSRAPLPVYCMVGDGLWHIRTLADTLSRAAGSTVRVRIIGPFQPPATEAELPDFLEFLREQMIATLNDIRHGAGPAGSSTLASNAG